jgi:ribosomal protein S18 acetylase RimI-like enzyme
MSLHADRITMLAADDVDAYVAHLAKHGRESGTEGDLPYGPYSRTMPQDRDEARARALSRWSTPLDAPGWRRTWGLWAERAIVGSVHLAGGELAASLHRVDLGVGVERPHRGSGWGRRLTEVAIEWAREQPGIDWIDLGVFEGNAIASALYEKLGFVVCGRTPDLFRVDGVAIHNVQMMLWVGRDADRTDARRTAPGDRRE